MFSERIMDERPHVKRDNAVRGDGDEEGFTLIAVLILLAMMSAALAVVGDVWYMAQRREKEQELLFVGNQFRQALAQYSANATGGSGRFPMTLEALLKDPRYPNTRRYLRKIYVDPMTGDTKWGLVKGAGGEIYGVYSLSEETPIKQENFRHEDQYFVDKTKYSEWVFMPSFKGRVLRR